MWEKNLNQKILLIAIVLIGAVLLVYPPGEKLRPGLDIAGGVSLIFEIDETGVRSGTDTAEEMKRLLQKRVDPKGVYDLAWRVLGRNRLEVQMPLPPPGARERRAEYARVLDELFQWNIGRGELEQAFTETGPARDGAIAKLSRGSARRSELLQKAAAAHDQYSVAFEAYRRGPTTAPATAAATTTPATSSAPGGTLAALEEALNTAEEARDETYAAVLATNLNQSRFQEILEMEEKSPVRASYMADFEQRYPELTDQIQKVVALHAEWRKGRGYLDGPADLQRLMRGMGVLEFRILADTSPENPTKYDALRRQLHERGPKADALDEYGWFKVDNPMAFFDKKTPQEMEAFDPLRAPYVVEKRDSDYFVLAKLAAEDGLLSPTKGGQHGGANWQLRNALINRDQHGGYCVNFELDVVGGRLFEELTRKNIGKPLCILVDDVAYSAPNIKSKIGSQGQITGDFSLDKVQYLVQTMQAGSLPARLRETPISERTIGSSLGATNRDLAFRSGLIGVILVGLFMAAYYTVGGLVADAAMMFNIVLVLAVMSMLQARFTLPGIAGIILTVGMSVDANVLIFERMREEKERGSSLRMIIKNGYDKAFSVILDSNLTTILTCVILYYVGSEEVKGFGLTLGWGVAMSMFTALFVTRTVFAILVKYGVLKHITMLKFIGVPKIDWYRLRKIFIPISIIVTVGGLALFLSRGKRNYLDVEFQGGVSAEVEVRAPTAGEQPLDDVQIAKLLGQVGTSVGADADKLAQAEIEPVSDTLNTYRLRVPGVDSERLAAILTEPLDEQKLLARGGIERLRGEQAVTVRLGGEATGEQLLAFVRNHGAALKAAGADLAAATVGMVSESGFAGQSGRFWNITTTEKNMRLVQYSLEEALGNRLERQQRVDYVFHGDERGRPFPIRGQRLEDVLPGVELPPGVASEPVTEFLDGAAMYFSDLRPPQSVDPTVPRSMADQFRNMRLQPGFEDYPFRKFKVIGVQPAGNDAQGRPLYSSAVMLVVDDNLRYSDNPERWYTDVAQKELNLATTALESEQTLRKVSQFKPQIAERASTQAILAIMLSWVMIIAYLWVRFGEARYGFAAVVSLVHDVFIAVAVLGLAGWIINPPGAVPAFLAGIFSSVGHGMLVEDFKINMTTVAAVLTIIGYSVNDTIVIFDRIRETRGRAGRITPQIINDAINQTLSRTILTATTVWIVVLVMYIFGGSSIRGFNYCMLAGTITGCYSSVAIAAPLLIARLGGKARASEA